MGLDQRRPLDPLATPAGVKIVQDFLGRLEYGGYTGRRIPRRSAMVR